MALFDRYAAAVRAKDVDAFLSVYDENVRVFDLWQRWLYEGGAEWRENIEGWFAATGDDATDRPEFTDIHVTSGGEVAGAHATVTYAAYNADGEQIRALPNRITWILRKTPAGDWKVVHEHTSAPVDQETDKVIFDH
jgi:ketosteroid isomerase-like protein